MSRSFTAYSASDMTGYYYDATGTVLQRHDPDPVAMVAFLAGCEGVSRAHNGQRLSEALAGGDIALGTPAMVGGGLGNTCEPLAARLVNDPSNIVLFGLGLADCLFPPLVSLQDHLGHLTQAITLARQNLKTPWIRGFHQVLPSPFFTPDALARMWEWEQARRQLAASLNVFYTPLWHIQPAMAPDNLHLTIACNWQIAAALAQDLRQILAMAGPATANGLIAANYRQSAFYAEGSAPRVFWGHGEHVVGLDLSGFTFAGGAIRLGWGQVITFEPTDQVGFGMDPETSDFYVRWGVGNKLLRLTSAGALHVRELFVNGKKIG